MKAREFLLFVTMPIWFPAVILGTVFLVVMGLPAVLYGPLWLVGKYGYMTVGTSCAAAVVSLSLATSLFRMGRTSVVTATQPRAAIECSRCLNMDPENMKGGKFSCTVCGFQTI